MRGTSGPDTRTTPTAPRPAGLAMATMVSDIPLGEVTLSSIAAGDLYDRGLLASALTTLFTRHCCTMDRTVLVNQ
jgi:hypothetical protein